MTGNRCPSCTGEGTLTCTECKDVKYCSRECQEADWPFHKVMCKSVKDFQTPPKPGMFRAVYFPPKSKKPEFRWMMSRKPMCGLDAYAEPDFSGLDDGHIMSSKFVNKNEHSGASMRNWVFIWYDDDFTRHYDGPNKAIEAATTRKNDFHWGGPIFAAKSSGRNQINHVDPLDFVDMDMTSYSDLIAYFIQFFNDTATAKLYKAPKVKGVKMYCDGDRKANKSLPRSVFVEIPRIHPIFENKGRVSDVSRLIGMPLVIRKFPKSQLKIATGGSCIPAVTFMQMGCDPSKRDETPTSGIANFGWAPMDWTGGHVPNVFISSTDPHPLQVQMVEAFADFCEHHLMHYTQWNDEQEDVYVEDGIDEAKRASYDKVVMDQMTPETWERYLIQWRAHQANKAAKAADVSGHSRDGDGLANLADDFATTSISGGDSDCTMGVSARQGQKMLSDMLGMGLSQQHLAYYED